MDEEWWGWQLLHMGVIFGLCSTSEAKSERLLTHLLQYLIHVYSSVSSVYRRYAHPCRLQSQLKVHADLIRGQHHLPQGEFWHMRGCHAQLMHHHPTFLIDL